MVLHDYECKAGHIFEAASPTKRMRCKVSGCKRYAERVFLSPRTSRNAQRFQPTLLYVKGGDVIVPGRNNEEHLPKKYRKSLARKGYQKVEIKTFREYERFQKEQSIFNSDKRDHFRHREQSHIDAALREGIADLERGGEVEIPTENGGTRTIKYPPLREMHPLAQAIAARAMAEARDYQGDRNGESRPHIEAFENRNSFYRDRDTDWKKRS